MSATITAIQPAMPSRRLLGAYLADLKFELVRMLRTPGMTLPFMLMPVPVYLLFGVVIPGEAIGKEPGVANYLFSGWCAFAVMGPALFAPGCTLAVEREAGLLKLKRALPAPAGSWLVAKTLMAVLFSAVSVTSVAIAALVLSGILLIVSMLGGDKVGAFVKKGGSPSWGVPEDVNPFERSGGDFEGFLPEIPSRN